MTANYSLAIKELFTLINTDWNLYSTAIIGYIPLIYWQDIDEGSLPDNSKYYSRVYVNSITTDQSTLSDIVGGIGKRRFTTYGIIAMTIYCRKGDIQASINGRLLSQIVLTALRKKTANVIIRQAKINELVPENGMSRFSILGQFTFDEVQ